MIRFPIIYTKRYQMKKIKLLLALTLVAGAVSLSSFSYKPAHITHSAIQNYAWYTPDGEFVAWSTLVNTLYVTGGDLDSVNGTLISEGYTAGGEGEPPSGTLVYKVYSHP